MDRRRPAPELLGGRARPLGREPSLSRCPGRLCGLARLRKSGGPRDEGEKPRKGQRAVSDLVPLLIGLNDKLSRCSQPARQTLGRHGRLGRREPAHLVQPNPRYGLGVDLVDVLATRAAGAREFQPGRPVRWKSGASSKFMKKPRARGFGGRARNREGVRTRRLAAIRGREGRRVSPRRSLMKPLAAASASSARAEMVSSLPSPQRT